MGPLTRVWPFPSLGEHSIGYLTLWSQYGWEVVRGVSAQRLCRRQHIEFDRLTSIEQGVCIVSHSMCQRITTRAGRFCLNVYQ
jgi:hypothetical protein